MTKQLMSRRGAMFFVGFILWCLLVLWTGSAFWNHIDHLGENYQNAAKAGALASEFAVLALIYWHCFDPHLGVRKWALIFAFILPCVILSHAGALRGINDATAQRIAAEKRLTDTLTGMAREQQAGVRGDATGTQRERLAKDRATKQQQAEIAKNAQAEAAKAITESADKIKESAIFPAWYLDGWMYSFLFITALAFVSWIFRLMMDTDIDADFDGKVDLLHQPQPIGFTSSSAPVLAKRPNTSTHQGNFYTPTDPKP